MYTHPLHRLDDTAALQALIAAHPLGAWVGQAPDGLQAQHVPFVLDRTRGPLGTLRGHVARANPVWRAAQAGLPSVVMFTGPQAYVSPGWYPGKAAHGRVVPTWNYVAVHAHGSARVPEDPAALREILDALTGQQEAGRAAPWRMADAPPDFIAQLMRAVVAIEIPIERLEGRCKASQDEDLADRHGTVQGLRAEGGDTARAVADAVQAAIERGT